MPDDFAENVGRDLREMAIDFLNDTSQAICQELQEICSTPSSRKNRSSPGGPPGLRTGTYASSFDWHIEERGWFVLTDIYNEDEEKSLWLEYGTERAAARPHLQVTFEKWGPYIGNRILSQLED